MTAATGREPVETSGVLADDELMADIRAGLADLAAGDVMNEAELVAFMHRPGRHTTSR